MGRPFVMRTSSSNVVGNTELALPAAAQIRSYAASATSTTVGSGDGCTSCEGL